MSSDDNLEPLMGKKDAAAWERFLLSPEGQLGLNVLRQRIPIVAPQNMDQHQIIFYAGKTAGYDEMFYQLKKMAIPQNDN